MNFIRISLRRTRRRNRIPMRLLAAVSASLLLLVITASLFAFPVSAKNGMRMPRTESGVVTDHDGIISGDSVSDEISDIGDAITDGIDDMLPGGTDSSTAAGDTSAVTTAQSAATTNHAEGGMADDAMGGNMLAWIIGLVVLAGVVVAIVLIIRFASRKEH